MPKTSLFRYTNTITTIHTTPSSPTTTEFTANSGGPPDPITASLPDSVVVVVEAAAAAAAEGVECVKVAEVMTGTELSMEEVSGELLTALVVATEEVEVDLEVFGIEITLVNVDIASVISWILSVGGPKIGAVGV